MRIRKRLYVPGSVVAIDTETTGLQVWHGDRPFAVGFCDEDGNTAYVEWPVDPYTRQVEPDVRELAQVMACLFDRRRKVFHHAKFDIRMLVELARVHIGWPALKWPLPFALDDTMFMAWCCHNMEPSLALKPLAKKYVGVDDDDEDTLKKLVRRLRTKGKKHGWQPAYDRKLQADGSENLKPVVEADYWMPQQALREHPEWLKETDSADSCEVYCVRDTERTMLLWHMYSPLLETEGVRHTYDEEMQEVWPIIYGMEQRGVRLDIPECKAQERHELKRMRHYQKKVQAVAWDGFSESKPKHLQKLLYDSEYLGLEVRSRTAKTGQPATNAEALTYHLTNETVRDIMAWRGAHKGWSSFFQKFLTLQVPDPLVHNGVAIHTDYRQAQTMTRRLASAMPNLQNIPESGQSASSAELHVRKVLGPRPGYAWYCWDYEQQEVRIYTELSQESNLLRAFAAGEDPHNMITNRAWGGIGNPAAQRTAVEALELRMGTTAAGVMQSAELRELWSTLDVRAASLRKYSEADRWSIAEQWLQMWEGDIVAAEASIGKKVTRAKGKRITFLKLFGGGARALMKQLQCSYEEAQTLIEDYNEAFPEMGDFDKDMQRVVRSQGYIEDLWGTKLYVPTDKAYQGVNRTVQGSAASQTKRAMVRCAAFLEESELDAHIVMQVHDELIFEWYKPHATREALLQIGRIMADTEGRVAIPMPVAVERCTTSWADKQKVAWCPGVVLPETTLRELARRRKVAV